MNNKIKIATILFVLLLTSCSRDEAGDEPTPQPQQVTRWECILFGSYPANEVVSSSFNAVDDYALVEGDVIVDATLYSQLEHAEWTDDDTEIGGSGVDDPARRFRSTLYAKCRGAWWSSVEDYRGNSFWFMRTNGYTPNNITYVCDFGYLYNQGTAVTCDDAAVLPAITVDLSKATYLPAPPVASTDLTF